jgi:hypothetical protein
LFVRMPLVPLTAGSQHPWSSFPAFSQGTSITFTASPRPGRVAKRPVRERTTTINPSDDTTGESEPNGHIGGLLLARAAAWADDAAIALDDWLQLRAHSLDPAQFETCAVALGRLVDARDALSRLNASLTQAA